MMDLKHVYATWILAGFIVTIIFLVVALVGGYNSFLTELVIDAAFGMIPFPFDLIVTWSMNPLPVIIQGIITGILLFRSMI
jgi:hypothetical protein